MLRTVARYDIRSLGHDRCINVHSIVSTLCLRELGKSVCVTNILNWKILKTLITSEGDRNPQQIASLISARSYKGIVYADGRLVIKNTACPAYTKNSLQVFNLNGLNGSMSLVGSIALPDLSKDRDFAKGPVFLDNQRFLFKYGFKTMLYCITSRTLNMLDIHNAILVETVQLPGDYKFSELTIDDETHLLAVASVKNQNIKADILIAFAIYEYFPCLVFQHLLEVKRSVFGNSLVGAEINQGILLALHKGNRIKAYSLAAICQEQESAPPVLFEITSFSYVVNIGANPFYMIRAEHYHLFRVYNMDDMQAVDGVIAGNDESFNSGICFHPDETPRLIFTDKGTLRTFDICEPVAGTNVSSVIPGACHSLNSDCGGGTYKSSNSNDYTTASGRTVRRRRQDYATDTLDDNLIAWDYESDMDILGVLYVRSELVRRDLRTILTLDLIDSRTNRRLRRLDLNHNMNIQCDELSEVYLKLDGDICLVSIAGNGPASIAVFRLTSVEANEDV